MLILGKLEPVTRHVHPLAHSYHTEVLFGAGGSRQELTNFELLTRVNCLQLPRLHRVPQHISTKQANSATKYKYVMLVVVLINMATTER